MGVTGSFESEEHCRRERDRDGKPNETEPENIFEYHIPKEDAELQPDRQGPTRQQGEIRKMPSERRADPHTPRNHDEPANEQTNVITLAF